jgi:uncharacterized protein (DUF2141 family)
VAFFAGTSLIGTDTSSPYSVTWNNVAAGTYALTAVARDNGGVSTTSAARTVIVTSSQSLPSGWSARDIGQPPVAGSATHNNGTFTVSGAGEMAWTADQFHYVYRSFTGDVEIISRVVTLQALQQVTKAGVMIREALTANSAYGAMFVSASGGMSFHRRLTTGGTRQIKPGSTARAPRWVRLERRGTTVTASESADGVSWTTVGSITLSQANMFVGLAVASAVSNQAATAQFDNVIVRTPSTPNQPPAVTLTAPANGATFPANASITLTANAGDTDGTIADVRFFAGTTLIGTDTTSPYSVTWNNVPAGTYSLTAVARDDDNATTTSGARSITVGTPPLLQFRAVFVASSNHSTAVNRYELKIFTAGSNPDTATPVATRDLGKPAVVGGECTVDITQTVQALSPGNYIATVTAIGPGGSARSAPAAFTR